MMKRNQTYSKIFLAMFVGIASLWMAGCSEEKPVACYIDAYTDYTDMVTQTKATLSGKISIQSGMVTEYGFYVSNKRAELETAAAGAKKLVSGGSYSNFTYEATGLSSGTTYYYRVFASNGNSAFYGQIMEFETLQPSFPTLGELHYSNVTDNSVDLSCTIVDSGVETSNTMTYGFEYKRMEEANWTTKTDGVHMNEDGSFSVTLDGLSPEKDYYIRAFAKNNHGNGYSNEEWITTAKKLTPVVEMDEINTDWWSGNGDVTATGVKVSGFIGDIYSDDGVVSEVGFLYGTNNKLTYSSAENRVVVTPDKYGTGGTFALELVNKLLPSTDYYICPYAKDESADGIPVYGYGEVKSFRTRDFESPRMERLNAESQSINSISVSVENMTYDGTLVEYGFIWRESGDYELELTLDNCGENKIMFTPTEGETVSSFSAVIEGLEMNVEYEIKAYAIAVYEVNGELHRSNPGYDWTYARTDALNIVKEFEVNKSTYTTLTVTSGVSDSWDGVGTLTECGFIWIDNKTYEENRDNYDNYAVTLENCGENKLVATFDENNAFEGTITGLDINTEYRIVPYVTVTYSDGVTRTSYKEYGYATTSELYMEVNFDNIGTDSFTVTASAGYSWQATDWAELGDTFGAGFCWTTNQDINPADVPEENRVSVDLTNSEYQKIFTATISVPADSEVIYYLWAYLKCNDKVVYSDRKEFSLGKVPGKGDHGNPEFKK